MSTRHTPQRLVSEVQMLRIRAATAESRLKLVRELARQAKRRRKEAKRNAQHARKQFKRSKAELAELKQALAKAEAKLFQAGGRALARKTIRAKSAAKAGPRESKAMKAAGRPANRRSASPMTHVRTIKPPARPVRASTKRKSGANRAPRPGQVPRSARRATKSTMAVTGRAPHSQENSPVEMLGNNLEPLSAEMPVEHGDQTMPADESTV